MTCIGICPGTSFLIVPRIQRKEGRELFVSQRGIRQKFSQLIGEFLGVHHNFVPVEHWQAKGPVSLLIFHQMRML